MVNKGKILAGVGIVALIVVFVVIPIFSYFFPSVLPAWIAQRDAAEQGVQNTYSWDNAVQNYEWFKQQKQDIQAQREQVENYEEQEQQFLEMYGNNTSTWTRQDRVRYGRIQDRITGAKNMHEQLVADYNARANQAHRSMFQCGLPYEMEKKFWLGDGRPDDKYEPSASQEAPENPSECTELTEAAANSP